VSELIRADDVNRPSARLGPQGNLWAADWLYRSRAASLLWLIARLWLGYGWLNAGYQKLWGSEKAAFWNGAGAGVKGFATAGAGGVLHGAPPGAEHVVPPPQPAAEPVG